jgi:hypothetical protein
VKPDSNFVRYGTVKGGTTLNFKVDNAPSNAVYKITIDNIECPQQGNVAGKAVCTTGARPEFTEPKVFITINGLNAFVHRTVEFFYASIWSDSDTWGGEFEPADGDSLYVPVGQVLLVDKSPFGVLNAIVVEGILLFAENANGINLEARYIFVRHGRLIIGTEDSPYNS